MGLCSLSIASRLGPSFLVCWLISRGLCDRSHSMNEVNFWKVCTFLIIFLNSLFDIPFLEVNHHMIRLVVIENGMGIITYINC